MPTAAPEPATSFGLPFGTVLAVLAMVAAAAGWHLPWAQGQEHLRKPMDLTAHEVDQMAAELGTPGDHEDAREAVRRLKENEGVRGTDVLALLDYSVQTGRMSSSGAVEGRAWTAARLAGHALVWVPLGALLIVLVYHRRPLGGVARGLLIAHGVVVAAGAALVALGASQHARDAFLADPLVVGWGLYALLGGSLLGLLVGLFGGKRGGFLGALGLASLLLASVAASLMACLKS